MDPTGSPVNPFGQEVFGTPVQPRRKKRKRFYLLLTALLLIGGAFGLNAIMNKSSEPAAISITPTPTESVFPTDTPAPSPTPTGPTTPTPRPTSNPVDSATGLNRADLQVAAQNGSGAVGAASKLAEVLRSFGYHVASVGNADNYNYENVTIQVKSTQAKFLPLLKKDLSSVYTLGSATSDLSASSSADAVIILGK